MNDIDVKDTVGVAQETVDLLVDENEGVEDDGDHDHEEDFAEEGDVEADDVSDKVDPEDEVEEGFGKCVFHPRELVDCSQQGSIPSRPGPGEKTKLSASLLDNSSLGNLIRSFRR